MAVVYVEVARTVLAALLIAAGVTKLHKPLEAAVAASRLSGDRVRPTRLLGVAAGSVEISVGVATVAVPEVGAPGAAALLVTFAWRIHASLRQGRSFECRCFGTSRAISTRSVIRALALGFAAAGLAVISSTTDAAFTTTTTSLVLYLVAALATVGILAAVGAVLDLRDETAALRRRLAHE
jgi:hypothetical protein